MTTDIKDPAWASLSYAGKNKELFRRQKHILDLFLERGAISKAEYEKSLRDLTAKMAERQRNLN